MSLPHTTPRFVAVDPITASFIVETKARKAREQSAKRARIVEELDKIRELNKKRVKFVNSKTELQLRQRLYEIQQDLPHVSSESSVVRFLRHEFSLIIPQRNVDSIIKDFFSEVDSADLDDDHYDKDELDLFTIATPTTSVY
jgi:hypothetical protein